MIEEIQLELKEKLKSFQIQQGSEQRTIGDLVEHKVKEICRDFSITKNLQFKDRRSKKSLEDFTLIENREGVENVYYFDPKTHDENSEFSMPNLSSIDKLKKLLTSDNESLVNIFVSYSIKDGIVTVNKIDVKFIWELDFSVLRIGSLGKGQLQISNMKNSLIFTNEGKLEWSKKLKIKVNEYHDDQIKRLEKEKKKWLLNE
jgi:hypothetical protein